MNQKSHTVHSHDYFENYFQTKQIKDYWVCFGTINGYDYSFPSDTEENSRLLAEAFLIKYNHITNLPLVRVENKLLAAEDELKRKRAKYEEDMKELCVRHRSQLMSVYYMLEAISKTGPHREKEAIIMYQKVVLESLINKGDTLAWKQDDLPF